MEQKAANARIELGWLAAKGFKRATRLFASYLSVRSRRRLSKIGDDCKRVVFNKTSKCLQMCCPSLYTELGARVNLKKKKRFEFAHLLANYTY